MPQATHQRFQPALATMQLDMDFVRRQFPPNVWNWAFFENAGGSFVPQSVIDRTIAYMTETQVQPGATFAPSADAAARIQAGHRLMAAMIGADYDEVAMGRSTTANFYVLAQALRPLFKPGDNIIVTDLDHEANNGVWRRLAEFGIEIREWQVNRDTADLEPDTLRRLLDERTRLVCFTHCSNITGAINDVAKITKLAHDAGAMVCIDGVAYAAHRHIDVKALDVDFYSFSLYKLYGPPVALLYGKRERLLEAKNQNHFFLGEGETRRKLTPGGLSHEYTAALVGLGEYFDALYYRHYDARANDFAERARAVYRLIAAHEQRLSDRFLDYLQSKPQIRLIGPSVPDADRRVPTFSFTIADRKSGEIPALLEPARVAIRAENFWSYRLMEALGIENGDGVVRASMAHYNTLDEVDRLIAALDAVI